MGEIKEFNFRVRILKGEIMKAITPIFVPILDFMSKWLRKKKGGK